MFAENHIALNRSRVIYCKDNVLLYSYKNMLFGSVISQSFMSAAQISCGTSAEKRAENVMIFFRMFFAIELMYLTIELKYFANEPMFFANEPMYFANEPMYFANEPMYFANEPMYFANEPMYFANEPMYFTNESMFFTNESMFFTNEPMFFIFCKSREIGKESKTVISITFYVICIIINRINQNVINLKPKSHVNTL